VGIGVKKEEMRRAVTGLQELVRRRINVGFTIAVEI
jgi:hypothetical protein